MTDVAAANRAMNKAASEAIAMSEMLLADKVEHMKCIAELEAALKVIARGWNGDKLLSEWEMSAIAQQALGER